MYMYSFMSIGTSTFMILPDRDIFHCPHVHVVVLCIVTYQTTLFLHQQEGGEEALATGGNDLYTSITSAPPPQQNTQEEVYRMYIILYMCLYVVH